MNKKDALMRAIVLLGMLFIAPFYLTHAQSDTLYVNDDAPGSDTTGQTWSNAFRDLQQALDSAQAGDVIWVAEGLYSPTKDKNGNDSPADSRTVTFKLPADVTILGGFDGTESSDTARDPENNFTNITPFSSAYHLVLGADNTIFDGFFLFTGYAIGSAAISRGGAILNDGVSNFTIKNCTIQDNFSEDGGGGIANINSTVYIENCVFNNNEDNNGAGGAIYNGGSGNVEIVGCYFKNNTAKQGGAIGNDFCSFQVVIDSCLFYNNQAGNGIAIGNFDTRSLITNCTFYNNKSIEVAGLDMREGCIYNWGGGSDASIDKCTFYKNNTKICGAIHNYALGISTGISNSIFFENGGDDVLNSSGANSAVHYSRITQQGYDNNNNIAALPMIYDFGNGDLRLNISSPCIDAGDPGHPQDPDMTTTDMGARRPYYDPVDDALITNIIGPSIIGTDTVKATLRNYGQNNLTNLTINWYVDGNAQTPVWWTGNLAKNEKDSAIVLGAYNFSFGEHLIEVRSSLTGDDFTGNDKDTIHIFAHSNKDIEVADILYPSNASNVPAGYLDVAVNIRNHSPDSNIVGATIHWMVDGVQQPDTAWPGFMDKASTSVPVIIGSYNFSPGAHTIKAWTSRPDSSYDDNHSNDTATITFTAYTYDIGVTAIVNPNPVSQQGINNPLNVQVGNYSGDSTINSFTLSWQINNGTIHDSVCTITIPAGDTSEIITLDSLTIPAGVDTITVWSSLPNGATDAINSNDQQQRIVTACQALQEQTFTIGASGADFKTFAKAIDTLKSACGISGAITFNIQPGTYYEQFVIPDIPGASKQCPIIFKSANDDSTSVTITDTTVTDTTNYIIKLDSADGVVISNLTLTNPNKSYPRIIVFTNENHGNIIKNNRIIGSSGNGYLIHGDGRNISDNHFQNNVIRYGSEAIRLIGYFSPHGNGNTILNNHLYQQSSRGVKTKYQDNLIIKENTVVSDSFNVIAIECDWRVGKGLEITYNTINCSDQAKGIKVYSYTGEYEKHGLIANNFITIGAQNNGCAGIHVSDCKYLDILYNNINMTKDNNDNTGISIGGEWIWVLNNNIVLNKEGNPVNNYNANMVFDYNNLYQEDGAFSLETLINNYGQCEHCISADPHYLSDSNLHTTSPLINNKGVYSSRVTHDIDGELRDNSTPDIGADEFTPCTPLNGSYTIGESGADFSTITEAVERVISCGVAGPVTFNIQPGSYFEQIEITDIPYASEVDSITFQSQTGDYTDVIITNMANQDDKNYTINIDASHITLKDITLNALNEEYSHVIVLEQGNRHINFINNKFEGPVATYGDKDYNSSIYYFDGECDQSSIKNIQIINNNFFNNYDAIRLRGCDRISRINIMNNVITNPIGEGIHIYETDSVYAINNHLEMKKEKSTGFYFGRSGIGHVLNGNTIRFTGDNNWNTEGIRFHSYNPYSLTSALICNNSISGVKNGLLISGTESSSIVFNTITSSYMAIDWEGEQDTIMNNIFISGRLKYNGSGLVSDYNNYYTSGGNVEINSGYGDLSIESWQDSSNLDAHSISLDPKLFGETLHTSSPLMNNKGAPVAGVTTDIDGESRDPVTPDIGADEYGFTIGLDRYACPFDTIVLYAGNSFDTYTWSTQAHTDSIVVYYNDVGIGSETYSVTVTSGGTDYTDEATVNFIMPDLAVMEDTGGCKYSNIVLSATSNNAVDYAWSGSEPYYHGSTDSNVVTAYISGHIDTGVYFVVTAYDSLGCPNSDSIYVAGYESPSTPIIDLTNDDKLYISNISPNATSHQWFCNTDTLAAIDDTITPTSTGFYQVKSYDHNCPSNISNAYHVTYVNINSIQGEKQQAIIYPNPARDHVYVNLNNIENISMIQIISGKGEIKNTRLITNQGIEVFDVSSFPAGIYIFRFISQTGSTDQASVIIQ